MSDASDRSAVSILFTEARSHNGWLPGGVSDELLMQAYDLAKLGPTSANCSPARFLFLRTSEAKERLRPALSSANVEKTMSAPVTVIVAHDEKFYDQLGQLFPHADAKPWFTSSPEYAAETALRNGALQSAYFMLAARAIGLDVGPMSGFKQPMVDELFLSGTSWKSDLLINVGHGDPTKLFDRLPRLPFSDACRFL